VETVAVKVTDCPYTDGFVEEVTDVDVGLSAALAGAATTRKKSRIPMRITCVFRNVPLDVFFVTISIPSHHVIACPDPCSIG
jgi:hypothetical protein